jgi:septum formation protein
MSDDRPRVVLASASPRRRQLLRHLVPDFDVVPSEVDESLEPGPLVDAVARLAERKARAVAAGHRDAVVIGADTIVVIDGDALGKPADTRDAVAMLTRLRGRVHDVVTGIAVVAAGRVLAGTEITRVAMARYGDDVIERYAASGSPLDKAGAYAVQDLGGALVDAVIGSYTNVVGFPLALARRLLTEAGVPLSAPPA